MAGDIKEEAENADAQDQGLEVESIATAEPEVVGDKLAEQPDKNATAENLEGGGEDSEKVDPAPATGAARSNQKASLTPLGGNVMSIKKIQGIKVQVQVMLGSINLSVSQLASLKEGELISLDSSIGDPIEVLANGQLIAKGEIVVIEDEEPVFGVTLSEIVDAEITA